MGGNGVDRSDGGGAPTALGQGGSDIPGRMTDLESSVGDLQDLVALQFAKVFAFVRCLQSLI
jgi:hypothetical protein